MHDRLRAALKAVQDPTRIDCSMRSTFDLRKLCLETITPTSNSNAKSSTRYLQRSGIAKQALGIAELTQYTRFAGGTWCISSSRGWSITARYLSTTFASSTYPH